MDFSKQRGLMGRGGSGNFNALDFSKLDTKAEFYKLVEGGQKFDILPFPVGKKHPYVAKGKLEKGDMFYSLPIYVHRDIGAGQKSVVCPNKNYGRPCPICEQVEELRKECRTQQEKDALPYARLRLFYNIVDYDNPDKGVQVFETSAKNFEEPLSAAQKDADKEAGKEGEPLRFFADPDDGLTIKVIGAEATFNGRKFIDISSVTLVPRKAKVAGYVEDAIRFDTLIEEPTYEELAALMNGADTDEEVDEKPARRTASDEDAPRKRSVEEDDDDELTAKKRRDDDEDERPAKKASIEDLDVPACPHKGGVFGKDNDEFDECESCKIWKSCYKAQK